MAVIDLGNDNFPQLLDCWFRHELNLGMRRLTQREQSDCEAWVHAHVFNAALHSRRKRMNVTEALRRSMPNPPAWTGSPLQAIYDRNGQDKERAALLYGNLCCRIGVLRPEIWCCFPQVVGYDRPHSRTYALQGSL
jgi:hypothetical protein